MRFSTLVVASLVSLSLSSGLTRAQSSSESGWLYGPVTLIDVSLPDPPPFVFGEAIIDIDSLLPRIININNQAVGVTMASLDAIAEPPFAIVYASTSRAAILEQRCTWFEENIVPKTIESNECFTWSATSSYSSWARVSFSNYQHPGTNSGLSLIQHSYNPTFSSVETGETTIYLSSGEKPLLMLGKQCDDNQFLAMLSKFCPHRLTRSGEVMTISAKPLPQDLDFQRITESLLPETLRRYIFAPSIKNRIGVFSMDRTAIFPPAYGEAVEKEITGELGKNTVPFAKLRPTEKPTPH
jgi:hypothetical protein